MTGVALILAAIQIATAEPSTTEGSPLPDSVAAAPAREPGSNVDAIGPHEGLVAMPRYLNNRAASIYGGSNEIQRDIIARLVLGL